MSDRLDDAPWKGVGAKPAPVRYHKNPVTENPNSSEGEVALVGAGPGDPELLTLKAWRLIQSAEVVLYDRLVSPEILSLIPESAERIHVGKQRANHTLPQDQINSRLVELARKGRKVVRLKGGDPFIFGRGGEEIETLAAAGVRFQVVPGITAASGCAAYAGIPLTHRDHAQSVRFVTGHLKNDTCDLPWKDFEMPVALVSRGTTPHQQVVTGDLTNIVERVERNAVPAPTLVIIGNVVTLRSRLDWIGG
jgi:siroheme synthase